MAFTPTSDGIPPGSGYPPPSQLDHSRWNPNMAGNHYQNLEGSRANPSHNQAEALVPNYQLTTQLQPLDTPNMDSPLNSESLSPMFYLSPGSSMGSIPYSMGHHPVSSWEEHDWLFPMEEPSADDESTTREEQAATVRRQRRIESERRYRNRTDFAYTELIESFELWADEISFPTKKTKEAQLRHATRLIRRGADYSRKFKFLCAENQQLRQRLQAHRPHAYHASK